MSLQITTDNHIILDGQRIESLAVQQREHGTVLYIRESRELNREYREIALPHQRYSLAHEAPKSGNPGLIQFETDLRQAIQELGL